MKKSLFLLGVAVAALTSCSDNEVTEIAEGRAIGFSAFVNHPTRTVTEVETSHLNQGKFYVFGHYGSSSGSYEEGTVHQHELASVTYYWTVNKHYIFGAYADGQGGQFAQATFSPGDKKLTFPGYAADDAKDLVVAVSGNETCADISNPNAVSLTFKHMLAQVGFTFVTTDGKDYILKVSDIKIEQAISAATGTYTGGQNPSIAWDAQNNPAKDGYTYTDIADLTTDALIDPAVAGQYKSQQFKMVIPQGSTDQLNLTFTAEISGPGIIDQEPNTTPDVQKKTFTLPLTYAAPSNGSLAEGTTANTWTPGFRYNYTATLNAQVIAGLKPIQFTATVEDWKSATEQSPTPQQKQ